MNLSQTPTRPWRSWTAIPIMILAAGAMPLLADSGRPWRGSAAWSVLLCQYQGSPAPAHDPNFYRDMFLRLGTGGMADYWNTISSAGLNLNGSVVKGWYTEPFTFAQSQTRSRNQIFQDCIDAARNSPTDPYSVPSGQLVAVITSPDRDLFGMPGTGSFLPASVDVGAMSHEVGHGLGLEHSFSDSTTYRNASWSQIGEYDDPWDLMSWANAFGISTTRFGAGPPDLNAFHLDQMGWLPRSRIKTFGDDGSASGTFGIAALGHPEAPGYLQIRVPFDPGDLFHYYTVEYRNKQGWDAGIPSDTVLIHEVHLGTDSSGNYYSYLLRQTSGARLPVQSLNANGVTISVSSTSPATHQAAITITSNIVDRCLQGYVWREVNASDHVCVTGAVRAQAASDNALAASRRSPIGGPYGPDTCLSGYVWREAFLGDHVCVVPLTRTQAASDNQQAASRRNPAQSVYGPNTCKAGYVWREADDKDWVCVASGVRAQTSTDNALAATRRNPGGGPYGPDTCIFGYVWRDAFPGDHVCVVPSTRTQAAEDNGAAHSRLVKP